MFWGDTLIPLEGYAIGDDDDDDDEDWPKGVVVGLMIVHDEDRTTDNKVNNKNSNNWSTSPFADAHRMRAGE